MFLNPLLLLGLTAVSVPIIIHILNRRKFQKVVWAAMRFVRVAMQKNQKRIQWEDILLLILRCVLVALIAIALSRPIISAFGKAAGALGSTKVTAVLLLDNSYSMSQIDGQTSKFEQAKHVADQVISSLPSGSNIAVMLASDVAAPVIPQPTYDLLYARDAVKKATLSDHASNMLPPLQKALEILNRQAAPHKEIYVLTDTQSLGWRQTGDIETTLRDARKEVTAHVIFIGQTGTLNLGVSDLKLGAAIATANRALRFDVQVTNYGVTEMRNVPVKIAIDSDPPSEETIIDSIPAGASKNVSLFARFKADGLHTVTAKIAADPEPADDSRTLVVRVVKQVQVLVADGGSNVNRDDPDSKSYFVSEALQPVPPGARDQFYIQTKTIDAQGAGGLALAQSQLDEYDAVVLANVADLPAAATAALERFVKNGGGLLIFPGPDASAHYYTDQLFRKSHLAPAGLGEPRGQADGGPQGDKFWTFQSKNYTHPIVSLWNDPAAGNIASAKFFRVFDLQLPTQNSKPQPTTSPDLAADISPTRIVVRYNDNKPAIVEHSYGLGRVIMLGVGAGTAWSDLPVRPKVFIPLMHRMLGSLLARQDEYLNVRVGQKFLLKTPADLLNKDALITRRSDDPKAKPATEIRRVGLVGNTPVLQFEDTDVAAAFDVQFAGDAMKWKFSTQRDPAESTLAVLSPEQLNSLKDVAHLVNYRPGGATAIRDELQKDRAGTELWMPLALLALALATTETLLAHKFSRSK
jgi:hypothetical protein